MTPRVFFHVSYSFHKWFLYYNGDFNPDSLNKLKEKVHTFEELWSNYEEKILDLIPEYTGVLWPYTEIHVYCFENAEYYPVPCISDPVSINMTGEPLELHLLYLIHELVHVITQFDSRFSRLSLDTQEAISYFVGKRVLEDILKDARNIIELFTVRWPYDFVGIAEKFKGRIDLHQGTVLDFLEKGTL